MTNPLHPVATAAMCERFDCGHITRSSSVPVKRALFLHLAEETGLGYLGGRETAHTLAALALMREGARCADILRAGGEGADTLDALAAPAMGTVTPRQAEALSFVADGVAYPDIARAMGISVETVRSLLKAAMRATLTHSATHAAVMAAADGLI